MKNNLEGENLKTEVKRDEVLARNLGINSVPYFVIDNKYSISGAQDPDQFLKALNNAYIGRNPLNVSWK